MLTKSKKLNFTLTDELEAALEKMQAERYRDVKQADMFRNLLSLGLETYHQRLEEGIPGQEGGDSGSTGWVFTKFYEKSGGLK